MLEEEVTNWGPKPFRSLASWLDHPTFKSSVLDKWKNYKVKGWGGYILKEKMKLLKEDLKVWNKEVYGNLDHRIEARKDEIKKLDLIDDTLGLEDHEIIKRNK